MNYCINPQCNNRQNPEELDFCQACGNTLLIENRYRIIRPLRQPQPAHPTEIFEVEDWGTGLEDWGSLKVLKVLKYDNNPDLVRLFKQEARVLMWLRHPGIPRVEPDGYFTVSPHKSSKQLHCLVMEKIEGENLEQWLINHGKIYQDEALDWLQQITEILDMLHSQNLLHRDLKPSNLILRPNGQLTVIDFGTIGVGDWGTTKIGSLGYAAPEQMTGEAVLQSDFFALGRTFVHLLTGQSPMNFPTDRKTGKIIWRNYAPQVSPLLADFIDELMKPLPQQRPKHTRFILKKSKELSEKIAEQTSSPKQVKVNLQFFLFMLIGFMGLGFLVPKVPLFIRTYIFPTIDKNLTNIGFEQYLNSNLGSAQFYYQLALKFNPENAASYLQLGLICENRQDFGCAKTEYQQAIDSAVYRNNHYVKVAAINNLSRLQIWLDGNSQIAIKNLTLGLQIMSEIQQKYPGNLTQGIESNLHKNLGWAYFQKLNYSQAKSHLKKAIKLNYENAPAQCLLAQVLEQIPTDIDSLKKVRQNCIDIKSTQNPETNTWKNLVRQRLQSREYSLMDNG
ncbi:MAG: protein kinase [Okeania sp. SIO3I5]|uniref:serine/threonine-protein kinase n=1 Tax=Okeania sp. SIO3I5 TaxID=2607805 RepID=UPI0013B647D3|nr:serine/threonine-protein kinase [Okeania sp. SIO3I5]NEQ39347.1 protein kinase [Okeania sp. SIO3I5]